MKTNLKDLPWKYSTGSWKEKPGVKAWFQDESAIRICTVDFEYMRQAFNIHSEECPVDVSENAEEEIARFLSKSMSAHELLKECYDFISKGANTFSMKQRIELEDKIKNHLR